jgi:hypothetical protein
MMSEDGFLLYKYHIIDKNQIQKDFEIKLRSENLEVIPIELNEELPDWIRLSFNKCPVCTLECEYCPVASNIYPIMRFFRDDVSYKDSVVVLETPDRNYSKHTSLQQGVSSMLGIIMVTSGCPSLDKLRPMVRFHLPFANPLETLYRALSMYLVQQYFRYKKSLPADWDLKGLNAIYEKVHEVNIAFSKRIAALKGQDANINSLIILDNFANFVNFSLDHQKLSQIEKLFGVER